ncbi:C-type lectin 37Db-like [Sabethes cyaneus]|uniref:C-type lectin 37Db-like n=1 Tax=Sabethes cyaneus TaxID=53552 RepID=UPI00237E59AE|nr:C-type lectin 37Db-like [Sabethes cyaneus]
MTNQAMSFLSIIVILTVYICFTKAHDEVLGNQTVRDILTKNKCLCPCTMAASGGWKNFLVPFKEGSWFEAISYCNENGMSLVQIRDQYDSKELQDWLGEYGYGQSETFWIAANDLATAGVFRWGLTNKQVKYKQWSAGEPNSALIRGETEHCVELIAQSMKWNDSVCSKRLKFICERYVE